MSKVEEMAMKAYPVVMTTLIPADEEHPLIEQDCNKFKRAAFVEGYHQAEKDLELTWEDIKAIDKLLNQCVDYSNPYQEVLKRFKEEREILLSSKAKYLTPSPAPEQKEEKQ